MKKLLALLLALVMVLSLAACGGEDTEETRKRRRGSADDETTEITEETEDVTEEVTEDIPEETEEVTEEVTVEETVEVTEPVEEEPAIDGVLYSDYYENEYLGIGFEPDSDWNFATDAEIEQSGYGASEDTADANGIFCDMMAANPSSAYTGIAANVLFVIQKESFLTKKLSDEDYAEAAAQGGVASLEAVGATNIQTEIVEVEIAGQERVVLVITSHLNGFDICQAMVFIRGEDYTGAVTITANSVEYCGEILEFFYEL